MLFGGWATQHPTPIPIKSNTFEEFRDFLTYLYVGECRLSEDNAMIMYDLAEAYNVDSFKEYCKSFVESQPIVAENIFQFNEFAKKFNLVYLLKSTFIFIQNNTKEVFDLPGFLTIPRSTLKSILESDFLTVNEDSVFLAVSCKLFKT